MTPAPIEFLTEFNIIKYLQNLSSGLTIEQVAHLLPQYRAEMQQAVQKSQNKNIAKKEANLVESDEEKATTATKVTLRVNEKAQIAIVDSGVVTSIITRSLMKRLECTIDKPFNLIVITANGLVLNL